VSKLRCRCGHTIRDQTDNLPYKAYFVPDEDADADMDAVVAQLEAFMVAREQGRQGAFIRERLGGAWPDDDNAHTIVYILLTGLKMRSGRLIYECESCGRLWIQKHAEYDKNIFASYVPESDERGVLRSQHEERKKGEGDSASLP
jgi:hypothetical protein